MKLDFHFVEEWKSKYDESEPNQGEYRDLVRCVRDEIWTDGSIQLETFRRIVNWKSPRSKGAIRWDDFEIYHEALLSILTSSQPDKMNILVALPGIGAPVAAAVLHFVSPEAFPIYDFRTTAVLHYFKYLPSKTVSPRHYPQFRVAVLGIKETLGHFSLRDIDCALFAFHKANPERFKRTSKDRP